MYYTELEAKVVSNESKKRSSGNSIIGIGKIVIVCNDKGNLCKSF